VSGLPNSFPEKPSTSASVGTVLGKAARSFKRGQISWRVLQGISAGTGAFLHTLRRVGRILWLEVTGFLFLSIAAVGGVAGWREYHAFAAGKAGPGRALVAVLFALVFAYFGVTSFWKARKD
jgi:hypothetical protein